MAEKIGAKPEVGLETKTYSADFIKTRIRVLLESVDTVKEIKNIAVNGNGNEIRITLAVKGKKSIVTVDVDAKVVLENKGSSISIKNHQINASKFQGIIDGKIAPKLAEIPELVKSYIEKEEGKKVQKMEIVNGELKVTFETPKRIEKVVTSATPPVPSVPPPTPAPEVKKPVTPEPESKPKKETGNTEIDNKIASIKNLTDFMIVFQSIGSIREPDGNGISADNVLRITSKTLKTIEDNDVTFPSKIELRRLLGNRDIPEAHGILDKVVEILSPSLVKPAETQPEPTKAEPAPGEKIITREEIEEITKLRDSGANVTVKRSNGRLEDGWKILGFWWSKNQEILVRNEEQKTEKVVPIKEFLSWQSMTSVAEEVVQETIPKTLEEEEVEKETAYFIAEFNLSPLLPEEFSKLNEMQKLKVIQELKRRIVDIVKSDAQTQYSGDLRRKSFVKSIAGSITREKDIKNLEKKVFEELILSSEGQALITENLMILIERVKEQKIGRDIEGNPYVFYLDIPRPATTDELSVVMDFNDKASQFANLPYEWGQEKKGKHKREYEKVKTEYEKAREAVLKIKTDKEIAENKGQAMFEILQADNAVQMEQLLNTHPEFEKVLDEFGESASGKEMIKTAGNFLQTITGGKNLTNKLLFVGGYGARMGIKTITAASSMSILGALGTSAVGGVIGWYRGKIRGKETLSEREKLARHGQKDTTKEKSKMIDIARLRNGLMKMTTEVEVTTDGNEKAKKLAKLAALTEYCQDQIEKGQVNFGNIRDSLADQYSFIYHLNQALILRETGTEKTDGKLKEKISQLLKVAAEKREGKISETQNEFIKKQALRGAVLGAGFATLGYGVRWLGEHMGWWGGHGAENIAPGKAENVSAADMTGPHAPDHSQTPSFIPKMENSHETIQTQPSTFNQDLVSSHAHENIELNPDAVIHKGEGIEHAFIRQIEHDPKLAESLGFKGGDSHALHAFAQREAHVLAIKEGYADSAGHEIRVIGADKVAYEIKMENGHPVVNEMTTDGKIIEVHHEGDAFETKEHIQKYEREYSGHGEPIHSHVEEDNMLRTPTSKSSFSTILEHPTGETEPRAALDLDSTPGATPEHTDTNSVETIKAKLEEQMSTKPENVIEKTYTGARVTGYAEPHNYPNYIPGQNHAYVTGYNQPYGPYGIGHTNYYYPGLSPEQNELLNRYPEFSSNPFNLTGGKLLEAFNAGRSDMKFLSEHGPLKLEDLSGKASEIMKNVDKPGSGTPVGRLPEYLRLLKKFSGLNPKNNFLRVRPESSGQYIARALQKLVAQGKLEAFEESARK